MHIIKVLCFVCSFQSNPWVTGITEIPTEITIEITEITMEITIKGWGGGKYDRLGWIRIGQGWVRGHLLGRGEIS